MAVTRTRKTFALTAAAAAAAVSLSACTAVVDGAAVAGDRGPCAHVGTPMMDVPASRGTEPQIRIPQPAGWQRTPELEEEPNARLALSKADAATVVMVRSIVDDDPAVIFDDFHTGLTMSLEEEGFPVDVVRTPKTLCGLPAEVFSVDIAVPSMGGGMDAPPSESLDTMGVVAQSGDDTYLIAVIQTSTAQTPSVQREAETILSGFEVLPQGAKTA
jgi:hypothetical protein